MINQQREIIIRIHCRDLPEGAFEKKTQVHLGIQKGADVIDDVPVEGVEVTFQATLRVGERPNGKPNFLGPYAYGTPEDRFLYLCWGDRIGNQWNLFGRVKIPLKHLDWSRIDQAMGTEPLTLSVAMTGNRGRAVCGTVKAD